MVIEYLGALADIKQKLQQEEQKGGEPKAGEASKPDEAKPGETKE
jgi:hypothetical protein